jgi:CxxC-x17-CxxC domain-containing protein
MFRATCSQCGNVAEVPFQPRTDRPVYCRDRFGARQAYR